MTKTFDRTFLSELFTIVRARLSGRPTMYQDGKDVLDVKLENYCAGFISGTFADPHDGQEYRLVIVPKGTELMVRRGPCSGLTIPRTDISEG